MNTVKEEAVSIFTRKKSKFIAIIRPVQREEEAKKILAECKEKYPFAKHYVYAYIIDEVRRCSDDKEPSKTAGAPILNVLEKRQLNHVICVVVRYFGGILLGAPGLVRAYSKSAIDVIETATVIPLIHYQKYRCEFSYEFEKKIHFLLKDATILEKSFQDVITYIFLFSKKDIPLIEELKKYVICLECIENN